MHLPKQLLVALLVTGLAWSQPSAMFARKDVGPTYAGLEFYGSSQVTRAEIEKDLALKPGATEEALSKAVNRLKERFSQRRIEANIDVANEGNNLFVTVDIVEPHGNGVPVRKMQSPHRVFLTSGVPLTLLEQLFQRIQQLSDEGRPATSSIVDGLKLYSDEPCNQIAKKLSQVVPPMRDELLTVITFDPDPAKRSKSVELLNWDPHYVQNCAFLMPVLDDASEQVRASVSRFIAPRIKFLPDNFPIPELVEVVSHQLNRPSHLDRVMALRALFQIVKTRPFALRGILEVDGAQLRKLASESLLSSIKTPAQQLLDGAKSLPELPKPTKRVQINEF